ncbi:putative UDP-rhamnose:rhamnosyltransferase 1 [Juglans microcarpa x Juglans regia]|uniref:putative UDP-rhamnose:rhamnosyltransferase 1 n=1 Tax=Juglans microcarpa x Juglans regia TaxID=2249226 RepID=UPI001B7DBCA4|nr:putative UDP-rhamnose:rhamnosyltransferase 1 [Juglans microcarpa x Juglans regia]
MAEPKKQLHIAMFPWLAFGHLLPSLELAKLIARRKGHRISFISTPRNIERLPKIPPNVAPLITLVKLPLPHVDNMPENAESTMDLPEQYVMPYLMKAHDGLQEPLSRFLETSSPDWIIHDFSPYWLPPIAARLGILQAFFYVSSASSLCFAGPPTKLPLSTSSETTNEPDPSTRTELEDFLVPPKWIPFPTKIAYRRFQVKKMFDMNAGKNDSGDTDLFVRFNTMYSATDVLAVKTCMEVEAEWLNLLGELLRIPVAPVGLLPPSPQEDRDRKDSTWDTISDWLDKKEKGSVVYVALGSEVRLSQENFNELALGLEQSRLPFFWAIRNLSADGNGDSIKLPAGFEERTKGRGIVWTGWAPQSKILGHESVGGIVTHCGWGSVTEALRLGRALIMLPFIVEQGLIARFLEEKQAGVEIPRNEEDGAFTRDSVAQTLRLAMKDAKGQIIRDKAKEMTTVIGNMELQHRYVDKFVELLENHRK